MWRGAGILAWSLAAISLFWTGESFGADGLRAEASAALRKAADYFDGVVSAEGGYLWRYSADLAYREGEETATRTQAWLQPPGTPSVGLALLTSHLNSGDDHYLGLARHTADALVRGQLRSGCWWVLIEFDPEQRKKHAYRIEPSGQGDGVRNLSTLDDNKSQSAIRFLMRLDATLKFSDARLHESVRFALDKLVAAQFPNGAWPQQFREPPEAGKFPVKKANYPETWSREFPKVNYTSHYTFNDNAMGDCVDVMLEAWRTYDDTKYRDAVLRCGEFILLAQMPDPQPIWAQQYDVDMHPAWARKFEPPSVTGGESQEVLRTLMQIYRATGQKKFLDACAPALAFLERSMLPDGRMARFYELRTNRPLYFTKDYVLTYDDSDMPTHYGFKTGSKLDRMKREHALLTSTEWSKLPAAKPWFEPVKRSKPSASQEAEVRALISALDGQGRWLVESKFHDDGAPTQPGQMITTELFIKNIDILARYLGATRE